MVLAADGLDAVADLSLSQVHALELAGNLPDELDAPEEVEVFVGVFGETSGLVRSVGQ
jgi:hypothetical protein